VNQRQQRNLQRRLLLTSPHLPIMTLLNNLSVTSLALNSRIIVLLIQVLKEYNVMNILNLKVYYLCSGLPATACPALDMKMTDLDLNRQRAVVMKLLGTSL
jgi:hypothetical protein